MAWVCRHRVAKVLWLMWPIWVWFTVMATANHYWLDVVVGGVVALVGLGIAIGREQRVGVAEATA